MYRALAGDRHGKVLVSQRPRARTRALLVFCALLTTCGIVQAFVHALAEREPLPWVGCGVLFALCGAFVLAIFTLRDPTAIFLCEHGIVVVADADMAQFWPWSSVQSIMRSADDEAGHWDIECVDAQRGHATVTVHSTWLRPNRAIRTAIAHAGLTEETTGLFLRPRPRR
jgi:hypothetical protein